ncbi:LuxR C-terminal-related transcriptional regulator [Streptomyces noursei]|uniref:LuxR C-terminal-related transcriptional regulator n=1 Tax=Streptomyces noursei TaxID=1971 RepID=UPI003332164D
MRTTTVARVTLAPRERQVLEGLADGSTLAAVALRLSIREGTASGYLKFAKRKLYGVSENAAALAVGYTTEAISRPPLLDPETLFLPDNQRDIVPLLALGMTAAHMAAELKQPVHIIRRDGRDILTNLRARNRVHAVKRSWELQLLTAEQVTTWLG